MLAELAAGSDADCHFQPAERNVAPWLRAMDIFVLPSLSEALSNSLMEAMGCGCCPLASDTGGNPELVQHGETGLLVSAGRCEGAGGAIGARDGRTRLPAPFGCASGTPDARTLHAGAGGPDHGADLRGVSVALTRVIGRADAALANSWANQREKSFPEFGSEGSNCSCGRREYRRRPWRWGWESASLLPGRK